MRNLSLFAVALALVACRDTSGDDTPMPDGPNGGGDVSIQEIQNDAMPACERIGGIPTDANAPGCTTTFNVKGVVVVAVDNFGSRVGDLYVAEPDGGPFSGIKVFGAPIDQLAALQVGDMVDIIDATKVEFKITMNATYFTTELSPIYQGVMTVQKVGTGAVPSPAMVDAAAIEAMTPEQRAAEWEKWEGVLITVSKARQISDVGTFGTADDQKDFDITGGATVTSALTPMPTTAIAQTCYQGITGIGDYAFEYLVLPRKAEDLVGGGTDCPAPSNTTIQAIQGGALGAVNLKDVYVAALSFNKKNIWLTSSLNAAPNEGIYVFRGNSSSTTVLPTDVVVGAKVDISGTAAEGNNDMIGDTVTQITGPSITVTAAPTTPPVAVTGQTAATLNVAATGESYESVLVTLDAVKVLDVGTNTNFYVGSLQQGVTMFISDDDVLRLQAADVGKCFNMTGLWSYNIFENNYCFLPITKDMEVTCP